MENQENLKIKKEKLKNETLKDDERLSRTFHQEHVMLSMANIQQKRQLIHLFVLVSSGIMGALLVFEQSTLIKNTNFIVVGLILLLAVIAYSFYYLTRILTKEGRNIDKFAKVFFKGLNLVEKSQKTYFENETKENWIKVQNSQTEAVEEMNTLVKKFNKEDKGFSYGLYIIFALFFLGLIFLVFSIID